MFLHDYLKQIDNNRNAIIKALSSLSNNTYNIANVERVNHNVVILGEYYTNNKWKLVFKFDNKIKIIEQFISYNETYLWPYEIRNLRYIYIDDLDNIDKDEYLDDVIRPMILNRSHAKCKILGSKGLYSFDIKNNNLDMEIFIHNFNFNTQDIHQYLENYTYDDFDQDDARWHFIS
jgi:hypothetical protein